MYAAGWEAELPQSKPDGFASSLWEGANPLRHRCAMPPPPKGGGFALLTGRCRKAPPSGELARECLRGFAPPSGELARECLRGFAPPSGELARERLRGFAPPGGAVAQRLRGFKSAEPEKTVKRSSRRTGVNLQFFPVQPSSLGLKGASSPFFVAPARRNRWHFSGSLLVSKENIPRQAKTSPAERSETEGVTLPQTRKKGCCAKACATASSILIL